VGKNKEKEERETLCQGRREIATCATSAWKKKEKIPPPLLL